MTIKCKKKKLIKIYINKRKKWKSFKKRKRIKNKKTRKMKK